MFASRKTYSNSTRYDEDQNFQNVYKVFGKIILISETTDSKL